MADPNNTKPGDLVGHDASGRVRIDRVVPLPWIMGVVGMMIVQAATLWFQVQAAAENIREMRAELRTMAVWQNQALVKDAENSGEIRELRRRVEALEGRRP